MADLVDRSGQLVTVADEEADALVASGQLGLRSDRPVNLIDSQGRVVNAEAIDAAQLIQGGKFRLAREAEVASDLERQVYESQATQAALEGAARGATLGLSDVALETLSPGMGEEIIKRETYNPGAALAGEAAGALGAALLTGGGSAAGTATGTAARGALGAARLASAPARAAIAAGERAGAVAAKIAGGLGKSALGRAAQAGIRLGVEGAVEGAISGAVQRASRDYLTDHEITAERIAAGAGYGALLGGAAGGVLGAGGSLASSGARKAWDALSDVWGKRAPGAAVGVAPIPARPAPTLDEIAVNPVVAQESRPLAAADILASESDDSVESLRRAVLAEDAFGATQQGAVRSIGDDLDQFARSADVIDNKAGVVAKKEWLKRTVGGAEGLDPTPYTRVVAEVQDSAKALRKKYGRSVLDEGGGTATLKRIELNSQETLQRAEQALAEGRMDDVFDAFDEHKRFLGRAQRSRNGEVKRWAREEYERVRSVLEDETLYGDFARAQKPINATWTEAIKREGDADIAGFFKRSGDMSVDPFEVLDKSNRESVGSFLNGLGTEELRGKEEAFRRFLRARTADAEIRAATWGDAATQAEAAKMREAAERIEASMNAVALARRDQTKWQQTRKALESIPVVGGLVRGARGAAESGRTLLGGAPAGPPGAAGMAATGEQAAEKASKGILERLAGGARKAGARVKRAARPTFDGAVILGVGTTERDRTKRKDQIIARAQELADPSSQARARVREALAPVRVEEPERAAALEAQVQKTAEFLAKKAGEVFRAPPTSDLWARLRKDQVSPADRERFALYAHAAENPKAVLESIADGDVRREEIEVLRELYPRLYGQVVQDVIHGLEKMERLPSYENRIKLGILLGAPTDPTLMPANIAQYQQLAQETAAQAQPAAPPRNPPKVAQQYGTLSDRVLAGQ